MAKAEDVASEKVEKELPTLASPAVRVPVEIRGIVAKHCAESKVSFSERSVMLWVDYLKRQGLVKKDAVIEYKVRGGGPKLREELVKKDGELAKLRAELAALKAGKRG